MHGAGDAVDGSPAEGNDRVAEIETQHKITHRIEFQHAAHVERESVLALIVEVRSDLLLSKMNETRPELGEEAYLLEAMPGIDAKQSLSLAKASRIGAKRSR